MTREETAGGGSKSQPTLLSNRRTSTGLHSSLTPPSRIITVVDGEANNNNGISDELSGSIWKSNSSNSSKCITASSNPSSPAHTNDDEEKSSGTASTILLPPDDIILLTQTTTAMIQQQQQTQEPQMATEKREEKQDEKAAYRRKQQQQQHEPSMSLLRVPPPPPPPPQTYSSSACKTRNSAANKDEKKISILSTDEILLLSQTTTTMMVEQELQHKKERESQTKTTTTAAAEEEDGDLQRNPVENARVRVSRKKARAYANHPSSSNTTTATTETCESGAPAPGVVRVRGVGYTGQGSSLDKFTSDSFSVEEKEYRAASTSTQGANISVGEAPHPQIQPGATLIRGPGEAKKIPSLVVAAEVVSPKDDDDGDDDDIEKKLDERLKQERSTLRMEMMKDAPRAEVIEKISGKNCSLRAKVFWGVFILLSIVGIVVGLVFGISRNENDNQNEIEESSAPIVVVDEEEGGECIAMVPETICYERIPGQGRSDVCTKEETMMKGGGGVPNLVAQSRLDQVFTADISILNGGEVAGDIMQGHFTSDMLDTLFRFENSLLTILLSGEQVIQVLEEGVEWTFVDNSTGCYPYAAGLRYAVDFGADFPHRLSQVEVKPKNGNVWMPINATQNCTVVTNSYLMSGGDGYYEFTRADQSTVRQVLTTPEVAFSNFGLRVDEFLDPPSSDYSTQSFIPSPKCRVCHEFHTFDTEP